MIRAATGYTKDRHKEEMSKILNNPERKYNIVKMFEALGNTKTKKLDIRKLSLEKLVKLLTK